MKIEIPTECPCCGSTLTMVNSQLFCRNRGCAAQLYKKLEHFAKVLSIKGLGEKTIEKLELSDITELYYMDRDYVVAALSSERMADKLLLEIEKSKTADLATVISAMSIPLCGTTAASKICSVVSTIDEITAETCKKAGLGDKVTQNLLGWLATDFQEMREFLPFSLKSTKTGASDTDTDTGDKPSVCITGKLSSVKTKAEAATMLEAAGYKVVDSVTKATKYLLDEGDRGSEKRKKAEQYGITIFTNLLDLINKE